MTRRAAAHGAVNLAQGFTDETLTYDMVWSGVTALLGGTEEGARHRESLTVREILHAHGNVDADSLDRPVKELFEQVRSSRDPRPCTGTSRRARHSPSSRGAVPGVFPSQRYPTADSAADRDVKRRIMAVLFSDDIPDPRDAAVVGLADTTGLLRGLPPRRELDHVAPRIVQVRKLDLIGRVVSRAVWDFKCPLDGPTVHVLGPALRLPAPGKLEPMAVDGAQFAIANVGGRLLAGLGSTLTSGGPLSSPETDMCGMKAPCRRLTDAAMSGTFSPCGAHGRF